MRAALYARYSTDLQNVASIEDQLTVCRAHAARLGAEVVAVFHDAAISGTSRAGRPGLAALLAASKGGAFDVVVCEALDRLTRSGGDAWDIYEDLRAEGVTINTIAEGEAQTLHIGLKGTMNALQIEELGRKTRRGQAGVAREGRHAGGAPAYGYRRVRRLDAQGELVRGLIEIDPEQAAVVRRIFRAYADGRSPRAIAAELNAGGVPGPRGGQWNASSINGNAARGNGVLHNALYAGQLVWGRQSWTKDRRTGRRRARTGAVEHQVLTETPELRIIEPDLWETVRGAHAEIRHRSIRSPSRARRPKRLLSGLVKCGCCGGPMIAGGPDGRWLCSARRERGVAVCDNGRSARADDVDARVIAAVREQLLAPEIIEAAVREFQAEYERLRRQSLGRRDGLDRELGEVSRRAERLVDQIADGLVAGVAVNDRLRALETRRAEILAELATMEESDTVVRLHPGTAARYRQLVEQLHAAMGDLSRTHLSEDASVELATQKAREALRTLVTGVVIRPLQQRGKYEIEIEGDLAPLLRLEPEEGLRTMLGAGARSRHNPKPLPYRLAA